jgi:2-amino-4-hydroxy-6-hydroxymethyldihydropteridine diphosphokinase
MLHRTILVAIGSNLAGPAGETPLHTCEWSLSQLANQPGLWLRARSRWFVSAPVPPSGQPDYVNGVARLWGTPKPAELLAMLHGIEAAAGRQRSVPNAARTLDLDLLAVDDLVLDDGPGALVLPHPRLHQRGFVLAPLTDVAPDWVHPVLHRSAAEMLAEADLSGLHALDGGLMPVD